MRAVTLIALFAAGLALSGCVAYDVASTTVGAVSSVAGTAVDVATAPVGMVTGGSDEDK